MKKVIVEITETGYKVVVILGEHVFTEVHERVQSGSKRVEGDFESVEHIHEDLHDSLTGFSFYEIMIALRDNP